MGLITAAATLSLKTGLGCLLGLVAAFGVRVLVFLLEHYIVQPQGTAQQVVPEDTTEPPPRSLHEDMEAFRKLVLHGGEPKQKRLLATSVLVSVMLVSTFAAYFSTP